MKKLLLMCSDFWGDNLSSNFTNSTMYIPQTEKGTKYFKTSHSIVYVPEMFQIDNGNTEFIVI